MKKEDYQFEKELGGMREIQERDKIGVGGRNRKWGRDVIIF